MKKTLLAIASAAALAFGTVQPAQAEPTAVSSEAPGLSVEQLLELAQTQSPEVQEAVKALLEQAKVPALPYAESEDEFAAAKWGDESQKKEFWTPAPVFGCGIGNLKVTGAKATVQPGPNNGTGPVLGKNNLLHPYIPHGHAFFHIFVVDEQLAPVPKGTDMKVAWLNLKTFKGGIDDLDDSVLGVGINAQTSKLVKTGQGPVIAAIAGKTAYRNGEVCTVFPAIGSTTVK
ncbi:hypothetical protein [Corynebacterium pelargi]|uniref:Uncharacterized protein n=1 Tax=Corynebacterium pelargi TaxID=1471400 RepID=A0A410WAA9_9CORY|nr:hypothetical protein [Corynebacterium pelargi]QAU52891.1 hypothetical protein CPELA_08175 [Corynebacterium pelargi]GGG76245.1 hypothetical protein GCM10007338_12430 [Corynebacterium pelargi]